MENKLSIEITLENEEVRCSIVQENELGMCQKVAHYFSATTKRVHNADILIEVEVARQVECIFSHVENLFFLAKKVH